MNPRHMKVFEAICDFKCKHGYSPTIRELVEITDYTSTSLVSYALKTLRVKGYIDYVDGKSRTITLVREE